MKYFIIFIILFSLFGCRSKTKYYTRRIVITSVTNKGEKKEVYRMIEIRELETKKLVERQERIIENYY